MLKIGLIGGTGSDFALSDVSSDVLLTPYGEALIFEGVTEDGTPIVCVARHRENQHILSNMINHRANIYALKQKGAAAIIATTSCGLLDSNVPLATPVVFDDMYFPDNRLPEGLPCTFYQTPGEPGRGHLIAPSHFSPTVNAALNEALGTLDIDHVEHGCYCYAQGPRFNSKAEIRAMQAVGGTMVSQTAAPEAVLAAELEIPYGLLGFATDYANGVPDNPTSIDDLNANIARAGSVFNDVCLKAASLLSQNEEIAFDTGFNYRFF